MFIAFKLNWWSVAMLPGPEPCRLELCCMPSLRTSIFSKWQETTKCVCICTYICTYVGCSSFGYVRWICIYIIYIYIKRERERERKWLGYGYGYTHPIENTRRQLKNRLFPSNCYVSFRRVKKYLPIWFKLRKPVSSLGGTRATHVPLDRLGGHPLKGCLGELKLQAKFQPWNPSNVLLSECFWKWWKTWNPGVLLIRNDEAQKNHL